VIFLHGEGRDTLANFRYFQDSCHDAQV
jgi:hypothetical protein